MIWEFHFGTQSIIKAYEETGFDFFIGFIILLLISCDMPITCESSIRKTVTPIEISGVIIGKIIDTPNRAQPNFILADSSKYEPCNYDIYLKAKIGDVIEKKLEP